jgi:hypothetical protein
MAILSKRVVMILIRITDSWRDISETAGGVFRNIGVCALGAQIRNIDFVELDFTSQTVLIVLRCSVPISDIQNDS